MGQKKYPPLVPGEVKAILLRLGFTFKFQKGSHAQYERLADSTRKRSIVTVDVVVKEFGDDLMQSMIRQSNFSRDEFYAATKGTARKANMKFSIPKDLAVEVD